MKKGSQKTQSILPTGKLFLKYVLKVFFTLEKQFQKGNDWRLWGRSVDPGKRVRPEGDKSAHTDEENALHGPTGLVENISMLEKS